GGIVPENCYVPEGSVLAMGKERSVRLWQTSVGSAFVLAAMVVGVGWAQDKNPLAGDANAAKLGEFQFRVNCSFCHGLGARGGGRGPDLTRAHKHHGDSDADLFQNISQGIPGTAMPANGTNGQGVGMTDDEIWQIITYLRS